MSKKQRKRIVIRDDAGNITFDIGEVYNGSVVTFRNNEDSTAVLNGFTIQNGYCGAYCHSGYGGGIWINDGSSPTLTNLIIKDNTSKSGGGISIGSSSSLILKNLVIAQNNSTFYNGGGGGLYVRGSEVQLINVTIVDNIATNVGGPTNDNRYGGGIRTRSSASLSLNNCILEKEVELSKNTTDLK